MAAGVYQDIITIGGDDNNVTVIEYNILNDSFAYIYQNLPINVYSWAQGWTQLDNALYFPRDAQINRYTNHKGNHSKLEQYFNSI